MQRVVFSLYIDIPKKDLDFFANNTSMGNVESIGD